MHIIVFLFVIIKIKEPGSEIYCLVFDKFVSLHFKTKKSK